MRLQPLAAARAPNSVIATKPHIMTAGITRTASAAKPLCWTSAESSPISPPTRNSETNPAHTAEKTGMNATGPTVPASVEPPGEV